MKSLIPYTLAAILAAAAISTAHAAIETPTFTAGPVASVSKADGPDADALNAIVQALNADQSLLQSKITVQMDENRNILLTGAALTLDQVRRASEVVAAQAGDAKVVNAILPDRQGSYTVATLVGVAR